MNRRLLFILEVLGISIPATWLWIEWGRTLYPRIFMEIVPPILQLIGLPGFRPNQLPDRFISYVPFLVLMVVTPRLSPLRRISGTLLGFALIFLSHLAFVVYVFVMQESETLRARPFVNIFPAFILLDAFPIALWALFAREFLGELAARTLPGVFAKSDTKGEADEKPQTETFPPAGR